ncbi:MAG: hypothetical protein L3J22_07835 [Xanthomonadales bacterium]|nr:hypothetical protein [Xanthomonadales bacterium]
MENLGVWKTIKIGFWIGIGFIIPQMIVLYGGTVLTVLTMPSMMEASFVEGYEAIDSDISSFESNFDSNFDRTDQIEIKEYRVLKNGNQLLILGSVFNKGNKVTNSIQLEAELSDMDGKFVYECSEYISKKISPGESENFQIKCGCGKGQVPEYDSVNVRVMSASSY